MSTRDHGTEQTKSTEVIHNTQYVPQPSFTEKNSIERHPAEIISSRKPNTRKQSCLLTQTTTLWKRNTVIQGEIKEKRKHKYTHPTVRNIVQSKLISRRCVKIRLVYIDSFLVSLCRRIYVVRKLRATFFVVEYPIVCNMLVFR